MFKDPPARERINSFALVAYIPEPLAGFLDRLRQELVPNCFLRAHVTILPPRPISSTPEAAWKVVQELVPRSRPFELQLAGVVVFPITDVIYVSVGQGSGDLRDLHDRLNTGALRYDEPYRFHPHITLAQELKPDEVDELVTVAQTRWAEYRGQRRFRVDKTVFVQNTRRNVWLDLGECTLGQPGSNLVRE